MAKPKLYEREGKFRCTAEELRQLHIRRIVADLSLSRYLVESGLDDGRVASPKERENRERLLFELRAIGRNLNQITARLNSSNPVAKDTLQRCLEQVEAAARAVRRSYQPEHSPKVFNEHTIE